MVSVLGLRFGRSGSRWFRTRDQVEPRWVIRHQLVLGIRLAPTSHGKILIGYPPRPTALILTPAQPHIRLVTIGRRLSWRGC